MGMVSRVSHFPDRLLVLMALIVMVAMMLLSINFPPTGNIWLPGVAFGVLLIFTSTFKAPLSGGVVSLMPMTLAAAFLSLGLLPAGWLALGGALISGVISQRFAASLGMPELASPREALVRISMDITRQTTSLLAAGVIYLMLGGEEAPVTSGALITLPYLAFWLAYLALNYVLSSLFQGIRGVSGFKQYLKALPSIFIYEGSPMIFAPLVAATFTRLGWQAFLFVALAVAAAALVMRNLTLSRQRLARQLAELDSLQAVGQALSSTLDLKAVLYAVYQQVVRLMPAETFYVALYDDENDEITFPLVVENGEIVQWASQRSGQGLMQYLYHQRTTQNRREQTDLLRRTFGVSRSQKPVTSWLGAPIMVGNRVMGLISVQSHSAFNLYDISHEELLNAIAAQAALGIQNAHLYSQTDQALARRVQELDSILNTVREGIMLLDLSYRVVALNRALVDFVGVAANNLLGASLAFSRQEQVSAFLNAIGYSPVELQAECQYIVEKDNAVKKTVVTLQGEKPLQVERTLAPVRDRWGVVTGWLLVFRDMSEELALQQLREDMTHMLVHDLRAPLAVLQGSLSSIPNFLEAGKLDTVSKLTDVSQRGVQRLLSLVSDILDIARLENGNMPLNPSWVDVPRLLSETAEQIAPLADQVKVELIVSAPAELPRLYVDAALIGRTLNNLVDNALKFTPAGGRVTLWSALPSSASEGLLWIGVSDSGPGIPPEKQEMLFEKFQQLSTPGARRAGSGLGLHYCKLAVEAHGGKIWVESQPEQGSTFVIQLPLEAVRS